jgi:WD40 repeat protein
LAGSEQYYQILGLEPGATTDEIKRAYRDLALVWHPDRFGKTPHLRQMAEQKMREINAAYAALQAGSATSDSRRAATTGRSGADRNSRPPTVSNGQDTMGGIEVLPEYMWSAPSGSTAVALSPDGATAWAAGNGLRGWGTATGAVRREFYLDKGDITALCVSPDGRHLFYGYSATVFGAAERREGRVCDAATGRERVRLKGLRARLTAAGFHPGGELIATGEASGGIAIWETASARQLRHLRDVDTSGPVRRVEFCAEGSRLVTLTAGELQERIMLWDATTGALIREFTTHVRDSRRYAQIQDVAPSPDGRWLLAANNDPLRHAWTLHLWDTSTDREVRAFEGHEGRITQAIYSPTGRWLLSSGEDRTVRLWDAATGMEMCRFLGAARAVVAIAMSADCRSAIGASADGKAYVWRLPSALIRGISCE